MPGSLTRVTAKELIRALERAGWVEVRSQRSTFASPIPTTPRT